MNLKSLGRKRFCRLSPDHDEVHVDVNVPWGEETLFTLEWREEADKYAVMANNNMYIARLVTSCCCNDDMIFIKTFKNLLMV